MKQTGETDVSKIFSIKNIIGSTVIGACDADQDHTFDNMSVSYLEINSADENRGFKISAEGDKIIITEIK